MHLIDARHTTLVSNQPIAAPLSLGRRQGGEALFNAKQQDHWTPLAVAKQRQNARMVEALERGALTFNSE